MVLVESALAHNVSEMAAFCARHGLLLAPHGKTTMCPRIHRRQVAAGAWAITVATAAQAEVCAAHGIHRILIANQVVGAANVRTVARLMRAHPALELLAFVDGVAGAGQLALDRER